MKKAIFFSVLLCFAVAVTAGILITAQPQTDKRETLIITMPDSEYIRNIDTNFYKLWLEEQTGLRLVFNLVPEAYSAQYLENILASGTLKTDILFLSGVQTAPLLTSEQVQRLGADGSILSLDEYIASSVYTGGVLNDFTEYDLKAVMAADNGRLYYVPAFDISKSMRSGQVLWINTDWLKAVGMGIPKTTEEFFAVLTAFRDQDPNQNSRSDEFPLAGSFDNPGLQSHHFILNAFTYNDPENAHLFLKDGIVHFAPVTENWRQGTLYLKRLYEEGLLSDCQFTFSTAQLAALANDPGDLLGAFTATNVTDVLLGNSQEILSKYVQVGPLMGPEGVQHTTIRTPLPQPGGVILSSCKNPDAAFLLLDLMMSEEAFLIARYGEQGVDWERAKATDMDVYGNRAALRIINPLQDKMQNQNFAGIGPFFSYPHYADGVTWIGYDAAYFNARAFAMYEKYQPPEHMGAALALIRGDAEFEAASKKITSYTEAWLQDFIQGTKDVTDDQVWAEYLDGYEAMQIADFIGTAQSAYNLHSEETSK